MYLFIMLHKNVNSKLYKLAQSNNKHCSNQTENNHTALSIFCSMLNLRVKGFVYTVMLLNGCHLGSQI